MPPQTEAETVAVIDKLHKLIREVPLEYLGDVEKAATDLFRHRREDEAEQVEEGGAGGACASPAKRRKKDGGKAKRSGLEDLKALQAYLREKVPVEAVLPSESLHYNPTGDFADHTAANTVSVDSFLWDEADVDELCDAGKLSRNFCPDSGPRNIKPPNFVSHSHSIPQLNFLFTKALPAAGWAQGGVIVDVGSRLGCVAYAASVLGGAGEAVGVEINKELCDVQAAAFRALGAPEDKVKVVCGDICDQGELLKKASVVVLHNPFHFFQDLGAAAKIWKKLSKMIKRGTLLVASPPLPEQLLQASDPPPVKLDSWLKTLEVDYPSAEDPDDEHADENGLLFTSIHLYKVL